MKIFASQRTNYLPKQIIVTELHAPLLKYWLMQLCAMVLANM